jgi:hypothetical protein
MDQSRYLLFAATALALASQAPSAKACGGFFCGRAPVDQTAERILFEVGDDSVTMTTQISYNGAAEDFAWVLPLFEVPDPDSLAVFPQRALTGLDAATGPGLLHALRTSTRIRRRGRGRWRRRHRSHTGRSW